MFVFLGVQQLQGIVTLVITVVFNIYAPCFIRGQNAREPAILRKVYHELPEWPRRNCHPLRLECGGLIERASGLRSEN